jgi:hypothetical protein
MRWLPIWLALAGCASAGPQNSIVGGLMDGGTGGSRDAPPDGAGSSVTMVETTSDDIALGRSFGCVQPPTNYTLENSYYRVFTPADYGVSGTLHVTQVDFAVDTAMAGTGSSQPGKLNLGAYTGVPGAPTLDLSLVTAISSTDITIPDGGNTHMTVPIAADIAASAHLLVELLIPNGFIPNNPGNKFLIGMSGDAERQPGYNRAPDCQHDSNAPPITMQSVAATGDAFAILMTVTGTASTTPN